MDILYPPAWRQGLVVFGLLSGVPLVGRCSFITRSKSQKSDLLVLSSLALTS